MTDETPDPIPAAASSVEAESCQPPRLGIIHLLAWTAITAVFFKVDAALHLLEKGPNPVSTSSALDRVVGFVDSTLMAAGIVGLAVLFRVRLRCRPVRFAPGHWILIGTLMPYVSMYAVHVAHYVFTSLRHASADFQNKSWPALLFAFMAESAALGFLVFQTAARQIRDQRIWNRTIRLLLIVSGGEAILYAGVLCYQFDSLSHAVRWIVGVAHLLTALALAVVAADDVSRVRRDWLHFLGVGLYIGFSLISLSQNLLDAG
jgi:hypothetical protein